MLYGHKDPARLQLAFRTVEAERAMDRRRDDLAQAEAASAGAGASAAPPRLANKGAAAAAVAAPVAPIVVYAAGGYPTGIVTPGSLGSRCTLFKQHYIVMGVYSWVDIEATIFGRK